MTPAVSVILPVRDGGDYLRGAVDSILGQALCDLELIIVDDHSRDGAVQGLRPDDPRVLILGNEGRGVSDAFNTGLARSRGRFIARMDADDIALSGRLERQAAYFANHPGVDICGACVEIFGPRGVAGGNQRYQAWLNACRSPEVIHRELFIESPIPNPTAMFRREAIERLGGYGSPDWPEDYDLYLRADALGMRMGKPEDVLLRWRDHEARLTRNDDRYDLERFQAAKAHFLCRNRLPVGKRLVIWGAGPSGRLMHDLLKAEGAEVTGFLEVHPRRIGGKKRDLPVWPLETVDELADAFILVAVGARGARARIRAFMAERGMQEGGNFLFVA